MDFFNKLKEFINYYKINLIGGGLLIILVVVSNVIIYTTFNNKLSNVEVNKSKYVLEQKEEQVKEIESIEYYSFDIKGAVINPGVYTLEKGKRIIEKTTTNMIQKTSPIFAVKPLISKEI